MPSVAIQNRKSKLRTHGGPCVVLCSRGYSFEDRLQEVVKYAEHNNIPNVVLLHCPEKKYSETLVQEVSSRANRQFELMKQFLADRGSRTLCFELVCRQGPLEENLESLIAEGDIVMVFVGMKMLDYRPEAIKKLQGTAFYFLGN